TVALVATWRKGYRRSSTVNASGASRSPRACRYPRRERPKGACCGSSTPAPELGVLEHLGEQRSALPPPGGLLDRVRHGHSGQQAPGVLVLRTAQDLLTRAELDEAGAAHHR